MLVQGNELMVYLVASEHIFQIAGPFAFDVAYDGDCMHVRLFDRKNICAKLGLLGKEIISLSTAMAKVLISNLLLVILLFPAPALVAAETPRIQVLGLFRDKAVVKINGQQVILKASDDAVNGIRLIRSNSRRAIIEANGETREYQLGSNVSTRLTIPESAVVRIPGSRGMYKTQGLINGRSVQFLVDTGASVVAMARPTADRLQIQYREQGTPMKVSTASQLKNAWHVKLNSVTVGEITLHQVDGTVIDTEHDQEILLGMSFLNRVKFSQDQGVVVLEARTN